MTQEHCVKLLRPTLAEHPARQGDRYIRPSDPHTGSRDDVEHEQSVLQDEDDDEKDRILPWQRELLNL